MNEDLLKEIETYISNLTGRTFIKSVAIEDTAINIFFFESYNEFKSSNIDSPISNSDYDDYFASQSSVEKLLVGESVRILREFGHLNNVGIVLPVKANIYEISVSRERLNSFLGYNVDTLSTLNDTWRSKFADVFIYNKANRERFLKEFVQKYLN
ncbi:hypothetical protein D3C75_506430 [compost metagenome]